MKALKVVIAGAVVIIVGCVVEMVSYGKFFNWVYELKPIDVRRSIAGLAQASSMDDKGARKARNVYCTIDSMDELPERRIELNNKVIKLKITAYRYLTQLTENLYTAKIYTKDRDKGVEATFNARGKERIKDLDKRYGDKGKFTSHTVYAIVSFEHDIPKLDILGNKCLKGFGGVVHYSWK